jgi:teichuronic acid biosynthesis glycosyltransferase TuaC
MADRPVSFDLGTVVPQVPTESHGNHVPPRILTLSSLFPSTARPRHGVFVETRLRKLISDCGVDARVIAPVPWFPFRHDLFGQYAKFAATPRRATLDNGIQVAYPRYLMLPRLGVRFQPDSMALACLGELKRLRRAGWVPDIVDAHYFYPDGVAAAKVARELNVPLVVTARGTDINVLGKMPGPARRILWASRQASSVVAVSTRLKNALVEMGVEEAKIVVLRNGVDLDVFRPEDRVVSRLRLALPKARLAVCIGNLVPEKGHSLAIEVLRHLKELHLVLVGDGPSRRELEALARTLGVQRRVSFLPVMPQKELRFVYSSADVMLLTSTREGWPNVVLESLACGTPVVSVDVGAVGEMLTCEDVGAVVPNRDPANFASAISATLARPAQREEIRKHAAAFDWRSISEAQFDVFCRALARGAK